jgi:hypothetical protein
MRTGVMEALTGMVTGEGPWCDHHGRVRTTSEKYPPPNYLFNLFKVVTDQE